MLCPRCRARFDGELTRCPNDSKRLVQDRAGQQIAGRYRLRELLGVGGMDSTVWLAWQESTEREVAIKLMASGDEASVERFARGARIASNLNHPNITVVHDYGRTPEGELFLVMERLEGQSLHRLVSQGPIPIERAIHITNQVLRALDHAHRKGVVHRDIKPGNLFLVRQNEDPDVIKVLDFGIARFVDNGEESPNEEITTARQVCGTPHYMAPEQVTFGQVDHRADLYALGVVLFRMLTGHLPFTAEDHRELFRQHVYTQPPSFSDVRPEVALPKELESFVMRALAKSPDARYASAAEMRAALKRLRTMLGISAGDGDDSSPFSQSTVMPDSPLKAERGWLPFALLFIVVAGLAALTVWLMRPPRMPTTLPDPGPVIVTTINPDAALPDLALAQAPKDAGAPDAAWSQVPVNSIPPGAQIIWRGQVLGVTPATLTLPPGAQELTLVHGRTRKTVTVNADEAPVVEARLKPKARPKPTTAQSPPKPRPARPVARAPEPPEPVEPEEATATAPANAPARPTVRMQLLDEEGAREFKVGKKTPPKAPVPAERKPEIELLD